jgi:Domain of unknown function (DUF5076)
MRPLVVPPAAQRDSNAVQMLSAWVAENGLHCTLNIGMWEAQGRDEARAWGILLADVVRHIANALNEERGTPFEESAATILHALQEELGSPTSNPKGSFSPGHS